MRVASACLFGLALSSLACAHHNVVRNSSAIYAEADDFRRAGDDAAALTLYGDVVRKTSEALGAQPNSGWNDEARLLLGRAHYRLGHLREARAALESMARSADAAALAGAAEVYLALVEEAGGRRSDALRRVERAFDYPLEADVLAEARLLQARLELRRGASERAWWAIDRAIEAESSARVEAVLTALGGALDADRHERARTALSRVLSYREAGERVEDVEAMIATTADRWSAAQTLELLSVLDGGNWPSAPLGRLQLVRARLHYEVGEVGEARAIAVGVRRGIDASAVEARILLSLWQAVALRDLAGLPSLRSELLPAASQPGVAERLAHLDDFEAYVEAGLENPIAWYAAAEVARDGLSAPFLARGLFLAYADAAVDDPWVPKALLAALDVSEEAGDRAWLRGRLEAYGASPYVLAARGAPVSGLDELEATLDARLMDVTQR